MGSGWSQLLILLLRTRLDDMDSVFPRPPWDGGGRGGGEWEVDGRNFKSCCCGRAYGIGSLHFQGPPGIGEGGGQGSGKWMVATLNSVVAAAP